MLCRARWFRSSSATPWQLCERILTEPHLGKEALTLLERLFWLEEDREDVAKSMGLKRNTLDAGEADSRAPGSALRRAWHSVWPNLSCAHLQSMGLASQPARAFRNASRLHGPHQTFTYRGTRGFADKKRSLPIFSVASYPTNKLPRWPATPRFRQGLLICFVRCRKRDRRHRIAGDDAARTIRRDRIGGAPDGTSGERADPETTVERA